MDAASALSQQWKERESKLFSQKAEVHVKEMKEMTGTPKIDPLSKKIAEIVTQRELQALGIRPTEAVVKKPTHVIPKPQPHISAIPYNESQERLRGIDKDQEGSYPLNRENNIDESERQAESGDRKEQGHAGRHKKKSEDMQNNVENIAKFQEELQREYPELGLNNSIEGSSFHTNELNELEEACKELSSEHHDTKTSPLITSEEIQIEEAKKEAAGAENLLEEIKKESEGEKAGGEGWESKGNGENSGGNYMKIDPDRISNKSENGGSITDDKTRGERIIEIRGEEKRLSVTKIELGGGNTESMRKDLGNNSRLPGSKRPEENFTSRFNNTGLQDFPSRDFANMQCSFMKASMLHTPQEELSKTLPRCHINLSTSQSSPLYFSIKASPDSKLKCGGGIGPVDSLRRLLLKNLPEEEERSQDFYEKNLEWMKVRNLRLDEIRNNFKDKDLEDCTFDPYFEKHESRRKEEERKIFEFRAVNCETKARDSGRSFTPKIPENIQTYSALSPADYSVRYREGFGIEKFVQQAKPMVPYRSINFLN